MANPRQCSPGYLTGRPVGSVIGLGYSPLPTESTPLRYSRGVVTAPLRVNPAVHQEEHAGIIAYIYEQAVGTVLRLRDGARRPTRMRGRTGDIGHTNHSSGTPNFVTGARRY